MSRLARKLAIRLGKEEQANTDPWFWGYLFQGAVILGMMPILIPILVARNGSPSAVGLVVGAFYFGQVFSPLVGKIADKTQWFAGFFLGGFVLIAAGSAGFVFVDSTRLWVMCALLLGIGAGMTNTTAFSYIVEFRPHDEWDRHLGWLQTFYGTGQAMGLLLAALLQSFTAFGMVLCAILMIPGLLLARVGLPAVGKGKNKGEVRREQKVHHRKPTMGPAISPACVVRHYEHFSLDGFFGGLSKLFSKYVLWITSWFFLMIGFWMIMNFLPLMMKSNYGITAAQSSLCYGIAATIGIFLYAPSGSWSEKIGSSRVVLVGAIGLIISNVSLVLLIPAPSVLQMILVPLSFGILPIAWSPLIVGGSALAGELAEFSQGAAMGIFNAAMAVASVGAAVVGGFIAQEYSYGMVTTVASVAAVAGTVLLVPLLGKSARSDIER
ncbi:MAG: MFS transporter [Verrucomicrobiota bacterium]